MEDKELNDVLPKGSKPVITVFTAPVPGEPKARKLSVMVDLHELGSEEAIAQAMAGVIENVAQHISMSADGNSAKVYQSVKRELIARVTMIVHKENPSGELHLVKKEADENG